jgi:hypothetical protein
MRDCAAKTSVTSTDQWLGGTAQHFELVSIPDICRAEAHAKFRETGG